MRKLFLVLAVGAIATSAGAAPRKAVPKAAAPRAASLPVFEFKGFRGGEAIDPSLISVCETPPAEGQIHCYSKDRIVAGIENSVSIYGYKDRMTMMIMLFEAHDFGTYLSAFRQKYGAPCKTSRPKWQNKLGGNFTNTVHTWCFKTGTLDLAAMSSSRDYGHVVYRDKFQPPHKVAPIDF